MLMKNVSDQPLRIPDLGIAKPLAPGETVEVPDGYALPQFTGHALTLRRTRGVAFDLSGGRLVPATDADRARYESMTVDDLPGMVQLREAAAERNAALCAAVNAEDEPAPPRSVVTTYASVCGLPEPPRPAPPPPIRACDVPFVAAVTWAPPRPTVDSLAAQVAALTAVLERAGVPHE